MAFNIGFQEKRYSEPLMHALLPCKGLVESFFNFIWSQLCVLWDRCKCLLIQIFLENQFSIPMIVFIPKNKKHHYVMYIFSFIWNHLLMEILELNELIFFYIYRICNLISYSFWNKLQSMKNVKMESESCVLCKCKNEFKEIS